MGWLKTWILDKFLKEQLSKILSKVSGPLDGKKSYVTGIGLLLLLIVDTQLLGEYTQYIKQVLDLFVELTGLSADSIKEINLYAFIGSLAHKYLKKDGSSKED